MRPSSSIERAVGAADLVEELDRDAFAFDPTASAGRSLRELGRGPFRREFLGQAAAIIVAQQRMQTTDRTGPSRSELVMAAGQQPQHLT